MFDKEKAFSAWWRDDVSHMHTTIDWLSAHVAFSAGWRLARLTTASTVTAAPVDLAATEDNLAQPQVNPDR